MSKSLFPSFLKVSHDYLMLLNKKLQAGERNKSIAEEATLLEWYYNEMESFFKEYEEREHILKLTLIEYKVTCKMLERELRVLMQAAVSKNEIQVHEAITSSNFDISKIDFNEEVSRRVRESLSEGKFKKVKERYKEGTSLRQILKYFKLTDSQLIEMVE